MEKNRKQWVNQQEIVKQVFEEAYENVVDENKKLRQLLMNRTSAPSLLAALQSSPVKLTTSDLEQMVKDKVSDFIWGSPSSSLQNT